MKKFTLILYALAIVMFASCSHRYAPPTRLYYTSLRPTIIKDKSKSPIEEASILACYVVKSDGKVDVIVKNLTDDILTIDQTKSFFTNSAKQSFAYYDPTVRTYTDSHTSASGTSGAFNLGGVANAFGIGGIAGGLMRATTVGGSNSSASSSTSTTYVADLPQVSIGPRGEKTLSKSFGGGLRSFGNRNSTPDSSPFSFSICITYSFDDGENWDQLITDFYCNDSFDIPITNRKTNDAVKKLLTTKPNATKELWYMIYTDRGKENPFQSFQPFVNYQ